MGYDLESILVTGASGYIGNNLFKILKKKYNCIGLSKSNNKFVKIDLLNEHKVKKIFSNTNPTLVIHCANKLPGNKNFYTNYQITKKILKYFKKPIIFLSSMTVYNETKNKNLSENLKLKISKSINPYAYYKKKTEQLIKDRNCNGDISLRIPGIFGKERKTGLIYKTINALKNKKNPNINLFTNNWSAMHIDHLTELIVNIIETKKIHKSKIVNISYKNQISIPIAINLISKLFKKNLKIKQSNKYKKVVIQTSIYEKFFCKIKYSLYDGLILSKKEYENFK
ncbi:NAD(P)-dependent oxidoreductase [Candidatus Pelagibacter sp.]|nr:NAD(P)-dependent oxidoreductase [Candidatus Pelagibacter sp.]